MFDIVPTAYFYASFAWSKDFLIACDKDITTMAVEVGSRIPWRETKRGIVIMAKQTWEDESPAASLGRHRFKKPKIVTGQRIPKTTAPRAPELLHFELTGD